MGIAAPELEPEPGLSCPESVPRGAAVPVKLPGNGHLPGIGARFPAPSCPLVTGSEYEALLAASEPIHPLFRLALIVVHETGHRIGAVRLLRWADIDLEQQLVRWRAENDKIGYVHETWLTTTAVEALQTARRLQPVISEWVFPAPSDPAKPISRHLVRNWWERG